MSTSKYFGNIVKSIVVAAAFAAIILAGLNPGIAKAADSIPANVVITLPPSLGDFDETAGQSWLDLHRVADHGMYTGTAQTAKDAIDIGAMGNHRAEYRGNREFVANGVIAADYMIVAHLGAKTLVMDKIHSVAGGSQYGKSQTDKLTWTGTLGSGSTTTGTNKGGGAAKPAAKAAAPLGTALCKLGAGAAITTTGKATIVVGSTGEVFTGKLLFIQTTTKMLTAEAALAAFAKDPKIGVERNLDGMPSGTKVTVNSGNLRVFRLPLTGGGKAKYQGDLDAAPSTSHTTLTRVDGVCEPFVLKPLRTPTTGAAFNLLALFMLIGGLVGVWVLNHGRLMAIRLPLARG